MKNFPFILMLLVILTTSCSKNIVHQKSTNMNPLATFDNTRWKLIRLSGMDSLPQLQKDVFIQFNASDSSFKGYAGCNNMTGKYRLTGNELSIGPAAMTRMMCAPDNMTIENGLSKAITGTDSFSINGDHLQLKKGGDILAEFEALYLK